MELTLTRKKPADTGPFTPAQPRVNLIPPAALERAADRRTRRLAVTAWAVSVLTIAAVWGAGYVSQQDTRTDLEDAQARGADLAIQLAQYAPVTSIASQTDALNTTVASQTSGEIDHAAVLEHFLAATGGAMTLDSLQIDTDGSGTCVSTDPFQQIPLAGCISFSGKASGGGSAASEVIAALTADQWFSDPFIPTVGSGNDEDGTANLSGTVGLTMSAVTAMTSDPNESPAEPGTEN